MRPPSIESDDDRDHPRDEGRTHPHARERAEDLDFQRAHLAVGVIAVVVAIVGVVFTALGTFDRRDREPVSTQNGSRITTERRSRTVARRWPPEIEVPAAIEDNTQLAALYRAKQLEALDKANERLRRFVTRRIGSPVPCDPVVSVSSDAVAALRCEVDGMTVSYVRLRGRSATDDYFGDRLRATVSHTWVGTVGVCHRWWANWRDGTGRHVGYLASRRRGRQALIVWSFDRNAVVAMASVRMRAAPELCDFWHAHA